MGPFLLGHGGRIRFEPEGPRANNPKVHGPGVMIIIGIRFTSPGLTGNEILLDGRR